ncbi:MAG: TrkH family potassium uptake protein [Pseudomonadota bacterium]
MTDIRPVLWVNGMLLAPMGAAMAMPMAIDLVNQNNDWQVFALASATTLFFAITLICAYRSQADKLNLQQAFLMTVSAWVIIPGFAALPFIFSELNMSLTDAYFEAMSGMSTTGATVINGLDNAPPGLLMWRALLQWLGGIGIVVMAVAILPMLQIGGMQVFHLESSDTSDKILPRAAQIIGAISLFYLLLTIACVICLRLTGMRPFDAVAHAMTTVATGGFSTKDASIGYFRSWQSELVITVFMLAAALPFVAYLKMAQGNIRAMLVDSQARFFLGLVACLVFGISVWLVFEKDFAVVEALRYASFNIVSVITGTGYASVDYGAWGAFSLNFFFVIMFIGGCAGSTSCGIKVFRFQVLIASFGRVMRQMLTPHRIYLPHYNGSPISQEVFSSVLSFFVLFLVCFATLSAALAATGLDPVTALSSAGSALANVGPGVGNIVGPAGNYQSLNDTAKWLLSLGMLLGRLELFTVLVLLHPAFWRAS